jgi:hypothetical protein
MRRSRTILLALPAALRGAAPRVAGLTWAERAMLLQAPVALPVVALALRRYGLARVQRRLLSDRPRPSPPATPVERLTAARRLSWCVRAAAAYGPWPANCLQRSVLLCWFLHRRGLAGDLRIGVQRADDGSLNFHSWVEHDGVVLNDAEDVGLRYATFCASSARLPA